MLDIAGANFQVGSPCLVIDPRSLETFTMSLDIHLAGFTQAIKPAGWDCMK